MIVPKTVLSFALVGAVAGSGRSNSHHSPRQQARTQAASGREASSRGSGGNAHALGAIESMLEVLTTMQTEYFDHWIGTWPTAIDWTAAVMGTHISGALSAISRAGNLSLDLPQDAPEDMTVAYKDNRINEFFTQVLGFYFGQDHFQIRNEAYDDILWVVLGWLETIQFIDTHTTMTMQETLDKSGGRWHGHQWTPAFAHRSRIFWNLAKSGWDWDLCNGGMVWNPRLEPYKNAITNQLLISASAAMYLYFPGDWNDSPFVNGIDSTGPGPGPGPDRPARTGGNDVFRPRDPAFLQFAVDGYRWLVASDMMNDQGLYIDGFHISGWNKPGNTNKKCDVRNEQVYTYNQGVILTGQLNLWKITGWDIWNQRPIDHGVPYTEEEEDDDDDHNHHLHSSGESPWKGTKLPRWHGLGRAGILEEACDSTGTCSQDAQTFKGIFLHHLTAFCRPASRQDLLLAAAAAGALPSDAGRDPHSRHVHAHTRYCRSYGPWLRHNTRAMMRTRDRHGRVGMWWTAGLLGLEQQQQQQQHTMPYQDDDMAVPDNAVDYRNDGVPDDPVWRRTSSPGVTPPPPPSRRPVHVHALPGSAGGSRPARESRWLQQEQQQQQQQQDHVGGNAEGEPLTGDLNDRGRGRTVETQGGGLALLRAYHEISGLLGRPWREEADEVQPEKDDEL